MQITLISTKVYYKFFYFVLIETTHNLSKEAAAKNIFVYLLIHKYLLI